MTMIYACTEQSECVFSHGDLRCADCRTFKEQKAVFGPPPRETGDAWLNDRGKTRVRRRG